MPDAGERVRETDRGQLGAVRESIVIDALHPFRDRYAATPGGWVGDQERATCGIKSAVDRPKARVAWIHMNRVKASAICKRALLDGPDATRDRNALDPRVVSECTMSNYGDWQAADGCWHYHITCRIARVARNPDVIVEGKVGEITELLSAGRRPNEQEHCKAEELRTVLEWVSLRHDFFFVR